MIDFCCSFTLCVEDWSQCIWERFSWLNGRSRAGWAKYVFFNLGGIHLGLEPESPISSSLILAPYNDLIQIQTKIIQRSKDAFFLPSPTLCWNSTLVRKCPPKWHAAELRSLSSSSVLNYVAISPVWLQFILFPPSTTGNMTFESVSQIQYQLSSTQASPMREAGRRLWMVAREGSKMFHVLIASGLLRPHFESAPRVQVQTGELWCPFPVEDSTLELQNHQLSQLPI